MTKYSTMLNEEGCPECESHDTRAASATVNGKDNVEVCICNDCGHTVEKDEEKNRILKALEGKDDDCLDELVYETAGDSSSVEANQGDDDDDAEQAIEDGESKASDINNLGFDGQVEWLLEQDVTEEDILKAIGADVSKPLNNTQNERLESILDDVGIKAVIDALFVLCTERAPGGFSEATDAPKWGEHAKILGETSDKLGAH